MLSSSFVQTYLNSPDGFCGKIDPFKPLRDVSDIETRLHMLSMASILGAFNSPPKIETMLKRSDHWLFKSSEVAYKQSKEVGFELTQLHLGGAKQDGRVWWSVCRGIQGRYKGSIAGLLEANHYDTEQLYSYFQENKATFPVLSGPVISVRWLDLVSRFGGKPLTNWESLEVPFNENLKNQAGFINQNLEKIHPAAAAALELWHSGCHGADSAACGWEECPKRGG